MRSLQNINEGDPICTPPSETQYPTFPDQWIPALGLKTSYKGILLSCSAWLTDRIVDDASQLIKKLSLVSGLQSVLNCVTIGFDTQPYAFLQILNIGSHWVIVSTIEATHPTRSCSNFIS